MSDPVLEAALMKAIEQRDAARREVEELRAKKDEMEGALRYQTELMDKQLQRAEKAEAALAAALKREEEVAAVGRKMMDERDEARVALEEARGLLARSLAMMEVTYEYDNDKVPELMGDVEKDVQAFLARTGAGVEGRDE